jgi:hypothetical protein
MSMGIHPFISLRHNENSKNLKDWERKDTVVKAPKEEEDKTTSSFF